MDKVSWFQDSVKFHVFKSSSVYYGLLRMGHGFALLLAVQSLSIFVRQLRLFMSRSFTRRMGGRGMGMLREMGL